MLVELSVTDLGVIDDLRLVLGPGLTALTGETGAGKTLLVEAIELLVGGRADGDLVRPGCAEAVVEGRFSSGGDEVVLTRVVPRDGRSRAYVDGRMATAGRLAELGRDLVDLHGQHAHQSLLAAAVQRDALDRFAGIDLGPLEAARRRIADIDRRLADLGGDAGARAREADLLRFQLDELDAAALVDAEEDVGLDAEEDRLADAVAHREAAGLAAHALAGEGGTLDTLGSALAALDGRGPFADATARLRAASAELTDLAAAVRDGGEVIADDPARLAEVRERRQLLVQLRRKYGTAAGEGTLADVLAYAVDARERLEAIEGHDERAAELEAEREAAATDGAGAAAEVGARRRAAAPALAAAVQADLAELAMPRAEVVVEVGDDDPGEPVRFGLAANPGGPPLPLAKVASGGELARAMLALRLVLSTTSTASAGDADGGPGTFVFDEVDAGIGGQAALAVGRSLASLGAKNQVLVVTHLPQVAAFADAQVRVDKAVTGGSTVARVDVLGGEQRVIELSRMLSGTPQSTAARDHASELLDSATREREAAR